MSFVCRIHVELMYVVAEGVMCSATIKTGKIGGREITYVSKTYVSSFILSMP
jgi:hypothetical protein